MTTRKDEEVVEELENRLFSVTLELEAFRTSANDYIRRQQENVSELIHLFHVASQERDEARNLLQIYQMHLGVPVAAHSLVSHSQLGIQYVNMTTGNMGIAGSNNLFVGECSSNAVPIPDISGLHLGAQEPCLLQSNMSLPVAGPLQPWCNLPPLPPRLIQVPPNAVKEEGGTQKVDRTTKEQKFQQSSF